MKLTDPFPNVQKREIKNSRKEVVAVVDFVGWSDVADRLDAAVPGWQFEVMQLQEDWCLGRLTIEGRHFDNVGYAENADADWKKEPLKDAVSDALKRCAAMAGVARYLYAKDAPVRPQPVQNGPGRPEPARVAPAPSGPVIVDGRSVGGGSAPMAERTVPLPTRLSEEDAPWPEEIPTIRGGAYDGAPSAAKPGDVCPEHNLPWKGEPLDLYHKMVEGGYHRHPANTPRARVRA